MFIIFTMVLVTACSTVKYVPVENISKQTERRYIEDSEQVRRLTMVIDSIQHENTTNIRDCVVVYIDTTGNIRLRQEWHNKDRVRNTNRLYLSIDSTLIYKMLYDSVLNSRDSVTQIPVPVERKLSKWEKFKSDWFSVIIIVLLASSAVTIKIIWWQKKKNKSNI